MIYIYNYTPDAKDRILSIKTVLKTEAGSGPRHLTFSPNGKYIATSSSDNTFRVWNISTGKQIFVSPVGEKFMTDRSFAADSK